MDEEDSDRGRKSAIISLAVLLLVVILGAIGTYVYWSAGKPKKVETVSAAAGVPPARAPSKSAAPKRITALCRDDGGNVWAGTEGQGVWRLDAAQQTWTRYTTAQGLGDNYAFAIAADRQGRIWVGHLNHGVSVFAPSAGSAEGQWRTYEPVGGESSPGALSGPLSPRVATIAVSPTDGDVWIGGTAGLTRYSPASDTWTYYTRENGLPEDSIKKIAFDSAGRIYLATDTHGIAMADATSAGSSTVWRTVTAPTESPPLPRGKGLPTNLINDVLVARDGTVYAATDSGLAWSTDRGATWQYVRGQDWGDIVRASAAGKPEGWKQTRGAILREDFCTCLAEDASGKILVGHRTTGGVDVVEPLAASASPIFQDAHYVICMLGGDQKMIGTYTDGIHASDVSAANSPPPSPPPVAPIDFPSGAKPPTLAELNHELSTMAATSPAAEDGSPNAIALDDDWSTGGTWVGRYGRYAGVFSAIESPEDYVWGGGPVPMKYSVMLGPHRARGDAVRYYIIALYTNNPLDLEIPPVYLDSRLKKHLTTPAKDRRPAFWNDNGYSHSRVEEGPDLYVGLDIPPGEFVLSFYSESGGNGEMRDFVYSVRHAPQEQTYNIAGFDQQPELAACRVPQFYGGVYKRFLVKGPEKLTVKVARNHGVEALVMAVMLDLLDERPIPYYMSAEQWRQQTQQDAESLSRRRSAWPAIDLIATNTNALEAAQQVLAKMRELARWNPQAWANCHQRISMELARWAQTNVAADAPINAQRLKSSALYEAGYYPQWEAMQPLLDQRSTRSMEKALRWDGVTRQSSGREFELFGKALYRESAISADTQPDSSATTQPN